MVVRIDDGVASSHRAQQLIGTVGKDFAYVHVKRRASAHLKDIYRELVTPLPCQRLIRSLYNGVRDFPGMLVELRVRCCSSLLDHQVASNHFPVCSDTADGKSLDRAS